ncbi:BCL-6 corepressor-like protein 1 [Chanos chanos]|uniref:BCL-6 corepressor-like protein 1 n=1 Tax=Chanos chanos TaxID=29144 RepID=A0A6J2ULY0_CHACN|nr:BCL-6 corepressor-like protein 1 [Chanos chanos]
MQVDPSPVSVGDGGTVSRESSAPHLVSESMVGNPPQTLPPELRGDVLHTQQNKLRTTADCKASNVCIEANKASNSNHCPEVPPSQTHNNAPMSTPALVNSALPERTEVPKTKAEAAGPYPVHQWPNGKKVSPENPVNSSNLTTNKKTQVPTQTQSVISLPPGFHCSTLFKTGQPVAFLPTTNFASPLCKITLPPGLGQIAALREATASQFQKERTQQTPTSTTMTPSLKSYPYHLSAGRGPATEKKSLSSASKARCDSMSSAKGCKAGAEHKSSVATVATPAIALPVQQATVGSVPPPRFTISPSAAICCNPALASINPQGRLLSLVEKGSLYRSADKTSLAYLKPKTSSVEEHNAACPAEVRDLPLDLSSKSKRQKIVKDLQSSPAVTTEHHPVEPHPQNTANLKRVQGANFGSATSYAVLPDAQKNGATQKPSKLSNHQALEPTASWVKGSPQGSLNSLPGTYVGVASPILASTLRSKDGKTAAFVEDIQTFAKQETISIIDQGEQLASRGKKAPFVVKGNQLIKGAKHSSNTLSAGTQGFSSKDALTTPLSASANSQPLRKSLSGKAGTPYSPSGIKPLWQQPTVQSQGTPVQRRPTQPQGPQKVKANANCEASVFKSPQSSPKIEDEKWEKNKSPLSNLESIVKQKALETTALTGESCCNPVTVGSRRIEAASVLNRPQDTAFQQNLASGLASVKGTEKWDIKPGRTSPVADNPQVINRQDAATIPLPKEKSRERHTKQKESKANEGDQISSKLVKHCQDSVCSLQEDRNKKESMLAQELEGEQMKEKTVQEEVTPPVRLEGIALSILQGQSAIEGEKTTNGTKEDLPSKGKTNVTKPKKPRKLSKDKTSPEIQKKSTTTMKKQQVKESVSVKQWPPQKKKKVSSPVLEQNQLTETTSPVSEEEGRTRKGKSRINNVKQPVTSKAGCESSPLSGLQSEEDHSSVTSLGWPCKDQETKEGSSPRLRRGRHRADEALRKNWSLTAPSTPHAASDPPSAPAPTTAVPPRRPRGRPRLNPLPAEAADAGTAKSSQGGEGGDTPAMKKRRRCRNRRYQNGEYITEKDKAADMEKQERDAGVKLPIRDDTNTDVRTGMYPRLSATLMGQESSPDPSPRRSLFTRSGSTRRQESPPTPESNDKPSGKRKFKSKHLCDTDEHKKLKTKRGSLGKRSASLPIDEDSPAVKKPAGPFATPKGSSSPVSPRKGSTGRGGTPDLTPSRPVPPEARRLIVNKNAGETLLQRAARLGYQDVVLYCLEKDIREVNRRDNAGYTALHEACARGWTHIVQVLLRHGADVNCSAQDGTRPIHDAVAADNLAVVWMLLNHGADPTLATYSGQTAVKLAQSPSMKTFLNEYFTDLEGRTDQDPSLQWDFYSSSVFETDQDACWDFLLSLPEDGDEEEWREPEKEKDSEMDCLLFEFSSEPLIPCYHIQISLTQGFCNWFLLMDVLKRLKMSARIFRARYPHFEVVSISQAELWKQVAVSQTSIAPDELRPADEEEEEEEMVELVRCVPELQGLLGSTIQLLSTDEDEGSEVTTRVCSR